MEIVVKTDYQDVYRVTGGVLLVVNKFEKDYSYGEYCFLHTTKDKPYNKLAKDLRITKEDITHSRHDYKNRVTEAEIVPNGTVLYNSFPVKLTENKSKWNYEIKTTANCFSGNKVEIISMIEEIKNQIVSQ